MDSLVNNFALLADREEEDAAKIVERSAARAENEKRAAAGVDSEAEEELRRNRRSRSHQTPSNYVSGESGVYRPSNYNCNDVPQINYGYGNGSGTGWGSGQVYKKNWQGNGSGYVYRRNWQGNGEGRVFNYDNHQQSYRRTKVVEIGADELFENELVRDGYGGNEGEEAVSSPGNDIQGGVSVLTEVPLNEKVPSKEEVPVPLKEVHSNEELSEEAKNSEGRKDDMRKCRTLKEFEEECAQKKSWGVTGTKQRKVKLDEDLTFMQVISKEREEVLYPKQQKSKDDTSKKNSSGKDGKITKTMSIEEFQKLATKSNNQGGQVGGRSSKRYDTGIRVGNGIRTGANSDNHNKMNHGGNGIGRSMGRYSKNNDNVNHGGYGRGRGGYFRNRNVQREGSSAVTVPVVAPPTVEVHDTVAAKVEPALELNTTNFPALGKARKLIQT